MILPNNKKLISFAILSFFLVVCIFAPATKLVKAEDQGGVGAFREGIGKTGGEIGYDVSKEGDPGVEISSLIGKIVGALIGFIGIAFIILIIMGALDIVGAGGNDEMVKKGKDKIKNGAIGILIVFAAYLFAVLVLSIASGSAGVNIFTI